MRTGLGVAAWPRWFSSAILFAAPLALLGSAQGHSLSGIVLPDLPPEVSPGEEITFTPPGGSEGGTWTLSGVVAESVRERREPAGAPPLPAPLRIALRLPRGGEPWTAEHLVGLAVAAAGREAGWQRCFGNPEPPPPPPRAEGAKEIDGVDVIIRKKPKGAAALATDSQVAVAPLPADYSSGAVREALGPGFPVRYFEVDASLAGCPACKSFYESRSNLRKPDAAAYALAGPAGTIEVETAGLPAGRNRGNAGDAGTAGNARGEGASTVIAASIAGLESGGRASSEGVSVVLAADRCEAAAMAARKSPGPGGGEPPGKPALRFRVPESLKPGQTLSVTYRDPTGNTVLDAREAPGVRVVPPRPPAGNGRPSLAAAPELAIAGRPVCVCGHFPDARSRSGFRLDEVAVAAVSTSSRMALLPLADAAPVGRHVISGDPAAGFSPGEAVSTNVIQVAGKLDANQLRRGQGTQMELAVAGTDRPVAFRIVNKTPAVISIGGKAEQVLTTSGGTPNRLVQAVDSVAPGNFNIDFSLAADRCPCQGERP